MFFESYLLATNKLLITATGVCFRRSRSVCCFEAINGLFLCQIQGRMLEYIILRQHKLECSVKRKKKPIMEHKYHIFCKIRPRKTQNYVSNISLLKYQYTGIFNCSKTQSISSHRSTVKRQKNIHIHHFSRGFYVIQFQAFFQ